MAPVDASLNGTATASLITITSAEVTGRLTPNATQRVTLIVAACYIVAIAILPYLKTLIYPFKLLTVGMHEMSHALAGVLTCGSVERIELDPDEGGATHMRGGVAWITLPAGYLGSSAIGAALIACGFDTNASKIACLDLGLMFLLTLFWARRSAVAWLTIALMVALILICWLVAHSVALRFLVLFIGVMSCMYCLWDIIDDTLKTKKKGSDASEFAKVVKFGSSRMWGAIWLFFSGCWFAAGIIVGIVAFKADWAQQRAAADKFLGGAP